MFGNSIRSKILFPFLDFIVACCQLSVGEFAFQRGFLQLLNMCNLLVPLGLCNQAVALPAFQPIIDPIILLKNRFAVGLFFLFFVSSYLAAGAFCFTGGDFVAIECVIGSDGEKILFAVSTLARQVSCCHSLEEIYIQKADQVLKMHSLRQNGFARVYALDRHPLSAQPVQVAVLEREVKIQGLALLKAGSMAVRYPDGSFDLHPADHWCW